MMTDNALTLEDAIIFIRSRQKIEDHGFKDEDKPFGESLVDKAIVGGHFSKEEYKRAYRMLDSDYYKDQLLEGQRDFSLIPREKPPGDIEEPAIKPIDKKEKVGSIGVDRNTWQVMSVGEIEKPSGGSEKYLVWISDCAVHIHTETKAEEDTEFTFSGGGAVDRRMVRFTMRASDLAYPQKFKAALLNAFGAENRIGKLNFEMVQSISENIRHLRRVEVPCWDESIPLVPGVDLEDGDEYRLAKKTPAEVYDGNIETAKKCLRNLLGLHKYAPILVTAIFGSPAYARWYPNDRFGVALWGGTGSRKTSAMLVALSIYGVGYADKDRLLKSDEQASTPTACGDIAAASGIMPQSYDNVKTVDDKQLKKYVSFIHNVLEGGEKDRAKKDGGVRDTRAYLCTPIITGEVRPQEASTTARVLNLNWSADTDLEKLSFVQEHVDLMPVIGYRWLMSLSTVNHMDGFKEIRARKNAEFSAKQYTNPGRLATNYGLLKATWKLLCESPLGDVFKECTEEFEEALDEAIEDQGAMVTEETEVSKFLTGLRQLIASKPELIQDNIDSKNAFNHPVCNTTKTPYVIGKWDDDGLFLLPDKALSELEKMRAFTQKPSADSITKALRAIGGLIPDTDGEHLKVKRRLNKVSVRGWLLTPQIMEMDPPDGNG
jgi:hypothetical protein